MDIGTVRQIDDNAYKRGLDRAKRYFGAMGRKKTIATLEVMLESKEEEIEWRKNYERNLERDLRKRKEKTSESQQIETEAVIAEGLLYDDGLQHLKPGDTVVLKCATIITEKTIDSIKENLEEKGIDVIILPRALDIVGIVGGNA